MTLPVLIIGGGLSGLSLAHSLQQQGVPYKLFERDVTKNDRTNQGWSISMRLCLPALGKAMDPNHFATLAERTSVNPDHPDDVQFSFLDGITNETLFLLDPKAFQAAYPSQNYMAIYRINRKRFRQWLLEGLDNVIWNKRLESYRILSNDGDQDSGVEATFTDGTTVQGSVLVGADGVHSVVCQQLMETTYPSRDFFQQATKINPTRPLVVLRWLTEEQYARVRSISKTSFFVYGSLPYKNDTTGQEKETVCAFVSLNDVDPDLNAKRRFQVIISVSRYDPDNIIPWHKDNNERLDQLKTWLEDGFKGNVQKVLQEMIQDNEQDTPVVTYLTVRERYPDLDSLANHQGRIALVGDAVHSMTMFRGEGGNHAILDATVLGQTLGDAYNVDKEFTIANAIQKYNEEMAPRCTRAVKESHDAAYNVHNSPDIIINGMKAMADSAKNWSSKR